MKNIAAGPVLMAAIAFSVLDAKAGDDKVPPEAPLVTLTEKRQARNTYIFKFDPSVPAAQIPARAQELVGAVGGELRHTYTTVLHGFAATMSAVALNRLLGMTDDIRAVEPDSVDHVLEKPTSCKGNNCDSGGGGSTNSVSCEAIATNYNPSELPWGVDRLDSEVVFGGGTVCGNGVSVYIIDTGIDLDHPDITPIGASVDCTKPGGCKSGGDDGHGHGTHVAGTVAARANGKDVIGVAPGATLHAVKVLKDSGIGFRSDIIAGIEWVANRVSGAPVVANMSIGGSGTKNNTCSATANTGSWTDSYHAAICKATQMGVVFVVAAGNSGADAEATVPAAYDDAVITATATSGQKDAGSDDWPSWSNWGDGSASWGNSAPVAIAAPGVSIVSTAKGGGTTTMSGTSMASPHVAGAVALFLDYNTLSAGYSAFTQARDDVTKHMEPTDPQTTSFKNTSGNPHDENFIDAECLVNKCAPAS